MGSKYCRIIFGGWEKAMVDGTCSLWTDFLKHAYCCILTRGVAGAVCYAEYSLVWVTVKPFPPGRYIQ